jgi:DNA topoisomerase-3
MSNKTVIVFEKGSQAKKAKAALGTQHGIITAAAGHIYTLAEPQDVNPDWRQWGFDLLRPPQGVYPIKPMTEAHAARARKAINDALKGANTLIIATDPDREGQLIGEEIVIGARFKGRVMRALFQAEDAKSLKQAFSNLIDNQDQAGIAAAAQARQQTDQIYNLSLTRAVTNAFGQDFAKIGKDGKTRKAVLGVGRVKTPTMGIVCRRELEIQNFRPETYFEIVAHCTATDTAGRPGTFLMRCAPKERITKRETATAIMTAANGWTGPLAIKKEAKRQGPPKMPDLPTLQRLCNSRFGWGADKTLEVAQSCYNGEGKEVLTYPRAECRYLPENDIENIPTVLEALQGLGSDFQALGQHAWARNPVVRTGKAGIFWDGGLAAHHAICPNVNVMDDLPARYARLTADEKRLFDLVAKAYCAAVAPDYEYIATTVTADVSGHPFKANGHVPTALGWKAVYEDPDDETSGGRGRKGKGAKAADDEGNENAGGSDDLTQTLPELADGVKGALSNPEVQEKQTQPPPYFSEGSLIKAMQEAWRFVDDKALAEKLKKTKGIGTPATRAEIIKGLKTQGWVDQKGRKLRPTDQALKVYDYLLKEAPELIDVGATAVLEVYLENIEHGKRTPDDVVTVVCKRAETILAKLKAVAEAKGWAPRGGGGGAPSEKMLAFAERIAQALGQPLPEEVRTNGRACSDFITANKDAAQAHMATSDDRPPTDKMLGFARKLAAESGVDLPEEVTTKFAACRAFIDTHVAAATGTGHKARAGNGGRNAPRARSGTGGQSKEGKTGHGSPASSRGGGFQAPRAGRGGTRTPRRAR